MRRIRVQIIQPLIPAYRVPLFRRLVERDDLRVRVCASRTFPGVENLVSVETEGDYADLEHRCLSFLRGRLIWQRGLRLDPAMGRGDVLIVCGNLRLLSNIPLVWKAKKRAVGVIWWNHGFSKRRSWLRNAINRAIVRLTDARLLYTDTELEEYKRLGFPSEKLFATNNAFDQTPVREAVAAWHGERLRAFQEREGLVERDMFLFCGRRTTSVSLELVFAALARLKRAGKKVCFAIIGPDDRNGVLGEKAVELGVDDCVRWLGPMFDQYDLAPWFLSARCFVCPGPIGLSLIHAFSYGLPAVVSDCEHGPEIAALHDRENGLFFEHGNLDDLTEKLSAIIGDPRRRHDLSARALQTVERDYNMDNMVERYVAAIKYTVAVKTHVSNDTVVA